MKPTVFIETTIPSFYHESRTNAALVLARAATRRWWDEYRLAFEVVTSPGVIVELGRTPEPKRSRLFRFMRDVRVLPAPAELDELTAFYIEHQLFPRDARGDAQHVAFASLVGAEFLLTWNCRHIANQSKVGHLTVLNRRWGLAVPTLATPTTLIPEKPR